MNFLAGMATTISCTDDLFASAMKRLNSFFECETIKAPSLVDGVLLSFFSDQGEIVGSATDDEIALVYLGTFLAPLPDWGKGSPLDDADHTAGYLLARYRDKQLHFLDNIHGHFAIAVLDRSSSRLLLASDPDGFRRIFLSISDGNLAFSTKIAGMTSLLGEKFELDRSMEDFLLGFEFLPNQQTPFQGIKTIGKGELIEWCDGKTTSHKIECRDPWEGRFISVNRDNPNEEQVIDMLYEAFVSAIGEQIPSKGKLAVLLGGFDSALVASTLTRLGREVETFSFGFIDKSFNQPHQEELASMLGTKHHWVTITPEVIEKGLINFSQHFNQVASQAHYLISTAYACTIMREKGFRYCLTGDGCDGLFQGYPTVHRRAKLFMRLGNIPAIILKVLLAASRPAIFEKHLGHPYRLGRNVLKSLIREMPARGHIAHRIYDELTLSRVRMGTVPPQQGDIEEMLEELAAGLEDVSPILLAYRGKGAVGLNRNKLEGSSDSTGVILYSPYMHPGMESFARNLPERFSRPEDMGSKYVAGKYILIKMTEKKNLLPESIIYQKKRSPVDSPIDNWYCHELKPIVYQLLGDLPFDYNKEYVDNLLRPKWVEDYYRNKVAIDHLASHAVGLLLTYSRFAKLAAK